MRLIPVMTYQSPTGETIDLTREQIRKLRKAHLWPRDYFGREYREAVNGLHLGEPTLTDAEVLATCAGYE